VGEKRWEGRGYSTGIIIVAVVGWMGLQSPVWQDGMVEETSRGHGTVGYRY